MRNITIILIILFLTSLVAGCVSTQVDTTQGTTGQEIAETIYPGELSPPAIHTLIVEPDDGKEMVLSTIADAHENISLTIYELNDPEIIAALIAAQDRGVSVRVLYNNNSFVSMNKTNPNDGAVANLTRAGVATKPASPVFTVTHHKTLTTDGSRSSIMTFNLEPDYFNTTRISG